MRLLTAECADAVCRPADALSCIYGPCTVPPSSFIVCVHMTIYSRYIEYDMEGGTLRRIVLIHNHVQ